MSRLKKSDFLSKLVFLIGLLLLWSLIQGFIGLKQAYRRVDEAKEILEVEEVKHDELVKRLEEVQKKDYLEKVIRNELNMQKEGEVVVVLQDNGEIPINDTLEAQIEEKGNTWEKWLDLVR